MKAKAREKKLLVLAKANSRSTVHRPAYLDYVGVKTFGPDGEVVGERRFLGLFSSAAYTESVTRIPVLREKVTEVMRHAGFDPRSHAGKALMDTLENYPRDELFHTSPDELAPVAQDVMSARERRQLRAFVRRDTYGRYVSVLVYLPRDRYSTAVRERFAAILTEDLGGEHVEFTARVNESTTAHVHFVVHPPKGGQIAEIDVADLERRLTEASRSWRDDFVAAVVSEYGVDEGSRLARAWANAFPEAYKEDYQPAARIGRPRPDRGHPGRGGHRPRALRPGRARRPLPTRRVAAQGLPRRRAAVAERDAADAHVDGRRGRRRAPVRARPGSPGPPSSTSSACATAGRSLPASAPCSPRRCARCGTATTRSTASTSWSSPPG